MTWSRRDIIAVIIREEYDIDVELPYWELRGRYRQARYRRALRATGSVGFAQGMNDYPPPSTKEAEK